MRRQYLMFLTVFILLLLNLRPAFAKITSLKEKVDKQFQLKMCAEVKLGLKFLCQKDWEMIKSEDSMIMVVSQEPLVTLSINKADFRIGYVEEITSTLFTDMDIYTEGFQTEEIELSKDLKAKMVKAFAKKNADIRLLDYYFINRKILYVVSFAVYPKEHWDDYKHIINTIAHSFAFLKYSEIYELKKNDDGIVILDWYY